MPIPLVPHSCRVEVEESLRNERRVGTVDEDGWMNGGDRDAEDDACWFVFCVFFCSSSWRTNCTVLRRASMDNRAEALVS